MSAPCSQPELLRAAARRWDADQRSDKRRRTEANTAITHTTDTNTTSKNLFHACYLLRSPSTSSVYIGYSNHPIRRLRQHNGQLAGGAKYTSHAKRRPWEMIMLVYGFPNLRSALMFEWAWQHPNLSTRLKGTPLGFKGRGRSVRCKLETAARLLQVSPWCRLPLSVHVIQRDAADTIERFGTLPFHMPYRFGPLVSESFAGAHELLFSDEADPDLGPLADCPHNPEAADTKPDVGPDGSGSGSRVCQLCWKETREWLVCPQRACSAVAHRRCLAAHFLRREPEELLPTEGECPHCGKSTTWGDLVRHRLLILSSATPPSSALG